MKECHRCTGQIIDEAIKCKHCGAWLKSYNEMMDDKLENNSFSEDESEYASLLSRVVGTFINGVIVMIMFLITIYLLNQYNLSNALTISTVGNDFGSNSLRYANWFESSEMRFMGRISELHVISE